MKNKLYLSFFIAFFVLSAFTVEATIKITSFKNESPIEFNTETDNGVPYQTLISLGDGFVLSQNDSISSTDGKYKIVFEDAGKSGFHRPHWKYHVWIQSTDGFPFLAGGKVLHSVFFYDGLGEMQIRLCPGSKLFVKGGRDVLHPWKIGTIGRGNPYHKISHDAQDENGVTYFDHDGFVGYPYNLYRE